MLCEWLKCQFPRWTIDISNHECYGAMLYNLDESNIGFWLPEIERVWVPTHNESECILIGASHFAADGVHRCICQFSNSLKIPCDKNHLPRLLKWPIMLEESELFTTCTQIWWLKLTHWKHQPKSYSLAQENCLVVSLGYNHVSMHSYPSRLDISDCFVFPM